MGRRYDIVCRRCKRKTQAIVIKQKYFEKNINRNRNDNPIYPLFTTFKVAQHRRGILKGHCNNSGSIFKRKGKYHTEDEAKYDSYDVGL
jgi:hypothetical protein